MTGFTLPDWLSNLGLIVSELGPAIALAGAVWLFFLRQNQDRRDSLRTERQKLYREFIAQTQQAIHIHHADGWELDPRLGRLHTLQAEIQLIGGETVIGLTEALLADLTRRLSQLPQGQKLSDTAIPAQLTDLRAQMLAAMKREIRTA